MTTRIHKLNFVVALLTAGLILSATSVSAVQIVNDLVDDDATWTLGGTNDPNFQVDAQGFVTPNTPTAGNELLRFANGTPGFGHKTFAPLLAEGTYSLNFDIGAWTTLPVGFQTGMLANGVGIGDLLTSSSAPFVTGEVNLWTLTYTVPNGDGRIGDPIGFRVEQTGSGQGIAHFDRLEIDFEAAGGGGAANGTPEPSTAVLAVLGLIGVAGFGRRCRRNRA